MIFPFCRSILSSATCSNIIKVHKTQSGREKKKRTSNFPIPYSPCAAKFVQFLRILVSKMDLAANISQAIPQALEKYALEL
jgi:hypothetical protein